MTSTFDYQRVTGIKDQKVGILNINLSERAL
jgi:hypothetical protein